MGGGGAGQGIAVAFVGLLIIGAFAVTALIVIVVGGIVSAFWPLPFGAIIVGGIFVGLVAALVVSRWAK